MGDEMSFTMHPAAMLWQESYLTNLRCTTDNEGAIAAANKAVDAFRAKFPGDGPFVAPNPLRAV